MNDEMFRLALIDITKDDLLNDFINDIFGYDFDLKRKEYVYIQYKIVEDNIILNIYDNKNSNRFKAYIFTLNDSHQPLNVYLYFAVKNGIVYVIDLFRDTFCTYTYEEYLARYGFDDIWIYAILLAP